MEKMQEAKSAKLYHMKTEGVQKQYGYQLLDYLPLEKGDVICDVGCGCGNLTSEIAKLVGEKGLVVGIDPHINRIKVAKKTYEHMGNLKFVACKSIHIPSVSGSKLYDSFISNAVLHWIPSDEKITTFKRMMSLLKPGGYFAGNISFNRSINMQLASSLLTKDEQQEIANFYYRENEHILKQMLEGAGFEIVEFHYRYAEINMGTIENFLDWITGTYYGKFNFRSAYNLSTRDLQFQRFENNDIKHTSEGALFVCRKPL